MIIIVAVHRHLPPLPQNGKLEANPSFVLVALSVRIHFPAAMASLVLTAAHSVNVYICKNTMK